MRPLLLAVVLGATALPVHAQVAQTWLRVALTPPAVAGRGPSKAVYPPQEIHLRFSHAQHAKAEVDCTQCHDMVEKSHVASDRNIPVHLQCESCHDIDAAKKGEETDPPASCAACHPGVKTEADPYLPNVFPANNLRFPHDKHLEKGVACTRCHQGIEKAELGTRDHLMKMTQCLECHDGKEAPNKCSTCHLTEPDGVLKSKFASGALAPTGQLRNDDHGRDFLHRHARLAQADLENCSDCHRQTECEACHVSTSKAFRIHPPDFMASHGMQSRTQTLDCTSCHREQSFCVACHQQTGAAGESRLRTGLNAPLAKAKFHPDGWMTSRANPDHHAFAAQQNMESCASCHQEQTCLKCHAATGSGLKVDPHPPGFKASGAACRAFKQSPVACVKCHGGGSQLTSLGQLLVGCP